MERKISIVLLLSFIFTIFFTNVTSNALVKNTQNIITINEEVEQTQIDQGIEYKLNWKCEKVLNQGDIIRVYFPYDVDGNKIKVNGDKIDFIEKDSEGYYVYKVLVDNVKEISGSLYYMEIESENTLSEGDTNYNGESGTGHSGGSIKWDDLNKEGKQMWHETTRDCYMYCITLNAKKYQKNKDIIVIDRSNEKLEYIEEPHVVMHKKESLESGEELTSIVKNQEWSKTEDGKGFKLSFTPEHEENEDVVYRINYRVKVNKNLKNSFEAMQSGKTLSSGGDVIGKAGGESPETPDESEKTEKPEKPEEEEFEDVESDKPKDPEIPEEEIKDPETPEEEVKDPEIPEEEEFEDVEPEKPDMPIIEEEPEIPKDDKIEDIEPVKPENPVIDEIPEEERKDLEEGLKENIEKKPVEKKKEEKIREPIIKEVAKEKKVDKLPATGSKNNMEIYMLGSTMILLGLYLKKKKIL